MGADKHADSGIHDTPRTSHLHSNLPTAHSQNNLASATASASASNPGGAPATMLLHASGSALAHDSVSRATSPGASYGQDGNVDKQRQKRYRPRTFPYFQHLPYAVEAETERDAALDEILKHLYIAVEAEDISPGAVHWTRELRAWLGLKFEITRALRVKLVKLYYMLALAPGLDRGAAERFESMFRLLTKYVLFSGLFFRATLTDV